MFYKVRLPDNQTRSSWRKPGRSRIAIITFTATAVLAATMAVIGSPFADAATVKKPIKRMQHDCYIRKTADGWPIGVTVVPGKKSVLLSIWTANKNELLIPEVNWSGERHLKVTPTTTTGAVRQFMLESDGVGSVLIPHETPTFEVSLKRASKTGWRKIPDMNVGLTLKVDKSGVLTYSLSSTGKEYKGRTVDPRSCKVSYGRVRADS